MIQDDKFFMPIILFVCKERVVNSPDDERMNDYYFVVYYYLMQRLYLPYFDYRQYLKRIHNPWTKKLELMIAKDKGL